MKQSAGILLYRQKNNYAEVFLVHPGGPFWAKKDLHSWSIPKGEFNDDEFPLDAAKREFEEETGLQITVKTIELKPVRQKGGKLVICFVCKGDIEPNSIHSNTFEMEWPPKSGKTNLFPEIDKGEWFDLTEARIKINESQVAFIDELEDKLKMSLL
jgi:predicted NUDIX family NTP pyrophosphohydrolase